MFFKLFLKFTSTILSCSSRTETGRNLFLPLCYASKSIRVVTYFAFKSKTK